MPEIPPTLILKGTRASPRGRGLAAARAFGPGEQIAIFGEPSIALPDSQHLDQTCNHCLSPTAKVRACTGCKTVAYCGPECQRADWALSHNKECKAFKRVRSEGHDFLPTPVRALLHMLVRKDMGLSGAAAEMEGHAARFQEQGPGVIGEFQLQAAAALHYLGYETNDPRMIAMAVELLSKLQVNSFNRLDQDVGQTGLFINPALAMVNHSCLPNAFVQFIGRKAVLRAYQSIDKDEEVLISYIDCALHRSQRRRTLKERYHFDCLCPRCNDDLDVYQVCQQYPHLELNLLSLTPDLKLLRNPDIQESFHSSKALQKCVEDIYPICSTPLIRPGSADDPSRMLRKRWKLCEPLRKAKLYAVEPLVQVMTEASIYFGERGNFPYSLALCCFLALHSNPFRTPMPFGALRVKDLLMIAKILSNTAPTTAFSKPGTGDSVGERLARALHPVDQMTMAQAVLVLTVHYAPMAHSNEWKVYEDATVMLKDIEILPDREKETSLINAWVKNPEDPEAKVFVEESVLRPMQELAAFALDIMGVEFES